MEKKITLEITGLNNSARAINNNYINLEKLMQMAGLSWDYILKSVAFEIPNELPKGIKPTSQVVSEAIENVIYIAKEWYKKGNYSLKV